MFRIYPALNGLIDILVGGLNPSEKYEFVNWDDDIPNIWENKKNGNQTTNQYKYHTENLIPDQIIIKKNPRHPHGESWAIRTLSHLCLWRLREEPPSPGKKKHQNGARLLWPWNREFFCSLSFLRPLNNWHFIVQNAEKLTHFDHEKAPTSPQTQELGFLSIDHFFMGKSPLYHGKITIFHGKITIFHGKITMWILLTKNKDAIKTRILAEKRGRFQPSNLVVYFLLGARYMVYALWYMVYIYIYTYIHIYIYIYIHIHT